MCVLYRLLLCTGLGRAAQVEEFLSMANWSVLKNPTCRSVEFAPLLCLSLRFAV